MANYYKAAWMLLLLSVIANNLLVLPCMADSTTQKKKLRKQLLKRSLPNEEIIETDDLIRIPEIPKPNSLQLSSDEIQKLKTLYGSEVINNHGKELAIAKSVGEDQSANEHKIQWGDTDEPVTGIDLEVIDEARLTALDHEGTNAEMNSEETETEEQKRLLDPQVASNLLEGLLTRLDETEGNSIANGTDGDPVVTLTHGHCNIHGLWLSTVAGAAIELIPVQQEGRIEIGTKIYDLPGNPEKGMITSHWTGKGVISSESPTTLTIVFQEHLGEHEQKGEIEIGESEFEASANLPKTAVFVGQCLVCENSPVLQGTWVVFQNTQSCLPSANEFIKSHPASTTPTSSDTLYLLQR